MTYFVRSNSYNVEFLSDDIELTCRNFVAAYYNRRHPTNKITHDDVAIVWRCYILGNWKVLATTTVQDGMYYELTYSDDDEHGQAHLFFDAYKRWENVDYRIEYDPERHGLFGCPVLE